MLPLWSAETVAYTEQYGKPRVTDSTRAPDICPSWPHSGDVALCAVSRGRDVDMGVEEVRPIPG